MGEWNLSISFMVKEERWERCESENKEGLAVRGSVGTSGAFRGKELRPNTNHPPAAQGYKKRMYGFLET